jgi:hypothetical protein
MDSFTVAPELRGTKGDIIAARIEVPILAVMIYGIVEFIRLGWSQDYYLYTYAPVLGGVSASVGLFNYFFLCPRNEKRAGKISWFCSDFFHISIRYTSWEFLACTQSMKASSVSFHFGQ